MPGIYCRILCTYGGMWHRPAGLFRAPRSAELNQDKALQQIALSASVLIRAAYFPAP